MSDRSSSGGPVFLTGLAHSGKTGLRLALEASGEISFTRKTYLWPRYFGRFGDLGDPANLRRALDAILSDPVVGRLSPDDDRVRSEMAEAAPGYGRLFDILHRQYAEQRELTRWGDQLGAAEQFADVIIDEIPDAVFVHMVRDPRERVAFASGRPGMLGWETQKWIGSARRAIANASLHPDRYYVVRYEQLRDDPRQLERICDLLELPFSPRMLTAWESASKGAAVPVKGPAAEFVLCHAGREMLRLGYPAPPGDCSAGRLPVERVGALARHIAERVSPRRMVEE